MQRYQEERRQQSQPADVAEYCGAGEDRDSCVVRYRDEVGYSGALLAAVQRCNTYDPVDFVPVLVRHVPNVPRLFVNRAESSSCGDRDLARVPHVRWTWRPSPTREMDVAQVGDEQVGWLNTAAMDALVTQLAVGHACELVSEDQLAAVGTAAAAKCAAAAASCAAGVAVRIAPGAGSDLTRTELMAALIEELVTDGLIPAAKLRHELQDVHPFSAGFVTAGEGVPPALRMERAAMIYFGVPSYGVHVNGYVRDPANPTSEQPWAMWVAKRSMCKATYPGLLDQFVAGGQPAGMSFDENVRKESEEEASLPPEVVAQIQPVGSVSYRYATKKGLSSKTLMTYDVEMPHDLEPLCADGEVEEFRLMKIADVLTSLRENLPLWKPNSALVAIDFCMRHGFVDETEPGYTELTRLLRQSLA